MQNLLKDIIELQVNGVQGPFEEKGRIGGAGPSDDKAFRLGPFTLMLHLKWYKCIKPSKVFQLISNGYAT